MAKKLENKIDKSRIELNKTLVEYSVTNNELLLERISYLRKILDYFDYGIKY